MKPIDYFDGDYAFLSNFWWSEVWYLAMPYPTVEHAFQAAKAVDPATRECIRRVKSPGTAKLMGRTCQLREDWEEVKEGIMYDLLWQKFTRHALMNEMLLATGTRVLIEGNTWNDRYWGVCNGVGQNRLGLLLMQVRQEIRDGSS